MSNCQQHGTVAQSDVIFRLTRLGETFEKGKVMISSGLQLLSAPTSASFAAIP